MGIKDWFRQPLIYLFLTLLLSGLAQAQSLSGLKIGDPITETKKIGLNPVARNQTGPFTMLRWTFPDGNDLSVAAATASGRIVYIESDWGGRSTGSFTDYPQFFYGRTTLADIRKRCGSNGMAFSKRAPTFEAPNGTINMNAYEGGNAVITFVTKIGPNDRRALLKKMKTLGEASILDAISLADPGYAEIAWGNPIKDPSYRPITWQ